MLKLVVEKIILLCVDSLNDFSCWGNCKPGARTAGGCCDHVTATLIWLRYKLDTDTIPDYHKSESR